MDKDRQGFVDFCELGDPMGSVYKHISQTGRGLYAKLNREKGKKFNDLCKNIQGVLKMIEEGKIGVNNDRDEMIPL